MEVDRIVNTITGLRGLWLTPNLRGMANRASGIRKPALLRFSDIWEKTRGEGFSMGIERLGANVNRRRLRGPSAV